jgi:hypothetical protein
VQDDAEMNEMGTGAEADDVDDGLATPLIADGTTHPASNPQRKSTNALLSTLTGPLVTLVHPTPFSFPPGPSEPSPHPPTTSALSTIHIRALECLNNLFLAVEEAQTDGPSGSAFSSEDKEGAKSLWNELWRALAKVGKVVSDGNIVALRGLEKKTEMWEIAVGVLWGIARVGRGLLVRMTPFSDLGFVTDWRKSGT